MSMDADEDLDEQQGLRSARQREMRTVQIRASYANRARTGSTIRVRPRTTGAWFGFWYAGPTGTRDQQFLVRILPGARARALSSACVRSLAHVHTGWDSGDHRAESGGCGAGCVAAGRQPGPRRPFHVPFRVRPRVGTGGVPGPRIPTEARPGPRMFERFGVDLVTGVVITGRPEQASHCCR